MTNTISENRPNAYPKISKLQFGIW